MPMLCGNRRVAIVVAAALLLATTAYFDHGDSGSIHHDSGQCSLCLQLHSTAGAPSKPAIVRQITAALWQPVLRQQPVLLTRRKVTSHLPRGPPSNDLI
jgi:Protein of unknown function (DUF2946)